MCFTSIRLINIYRIFFQDVLEPGACPVDYKCMSYQPLLSSLKHLLEKVIKSHQIQCHYITEVVKIVRQIDLSPVRFQKYSESWTPLVINCEKETKTMLLFYKSSVNKTHRLQYVNPSHHVFRVWVLIWDKPKRHKCGGCELKRCDFFNTKPSYQVRGHISEKICSRRKTCESAQHAPCCALWM